MQTQTDNAEANGQRPLAAARGSASPRQEHLAWCKKRALEYCDAGDVSQAWASMVSDMRKHPETEDHAALQLGMMLYMGGHLSSPMEMRKYIEGFN